MGLWFTITLPQIDLQIKCVFVRIYSSDKLSCWCTHCCSRICHILWPRDFISKSNFNFSIMRSAISSVIPLIRTNSRRSIGDRNTKHRRRIMCESNANSKIEKSKNKIYCFCGCYRSIWIRVSRMLRWCVALLIFSFLSFHRSIPVGNSLNRRRRP